MTLIDRVEALGAAVEAESISRDDAIATLMEENAHGITEAGAAEMLDRWRTMRLPDPRVPRCQVTVRDWMWKANVR